MSNSWFQFKQFTVQQDRCAMKVSTDACILGAWTPTNRAVQRALDIGAGTGLLSLMLAQRMPAAYFDAVELDAEAALQAMENVAASPFGSRIRVSHADAADWEAPEGYDLIVSNPPFFSRALLGPDAARNAARHAGSLDADALIRIVYRLLSPEGYASFLWPLQEHHEFLSKAAERLFLMKSLFIRHREGGKVTRVVSIWGKLPVAGPTEETLTIKDATDHYTPQFAALLSPFYLNL